MDDYRADGKALPPDVIDRVLAFGPLRRCLVHNKESRRIPGYLQKIS